MSSDWKSQIQSNQIKSHTQNKTPNLCFCLKKLTSGQTVKTSKHSKVLQMNVSTKLVLGKFFTQEAEKVCRYGGYPLSCPACVVLTETASVSSLHQTKFYQHHQSRAVYRRARVRDRACINADLLLRRKKKGGQRCSRYTRAAHGEARCRADHFALWMSSVRLKVTAMASHF